MEVSDALTDLHGAIASADLAAAAAAFAAPAAPFAAPASHVAQPRTLVLAPDVLDALSTAALDLVRARPTIAELRAGLVARLRRLATIERTAGALAIDAIDRVIDDLVAARRLAREGDRVSLANADDGDSAAEDRAAAFTRLE